MVRVKLGGDNYGLQNKQKGMLKMVMEYRCAQADHTNLNDEHDDEANHGGEQLEKSSNVFLSLPLKHLTTFCKVDPSQLHR